jgi:HD-like signal output (HDOD) protein
MASVEFEFIQGLTADLSSQELVFPTSLTATMKIRSVLNNVEAPIEKIARVIGTEPVLSAHVLRMANSTAFSYGNQRTADLQMATSRLGLNRVRNLAIWVGMKQLTVSSAKGPMTHLVDGLWTRTIRLAATSYVLAKNLTQVDPDSAMMAGLLHDIGKFYILFRAGKYSELFIDAGALWEIVDRWRQDIGASILENWEVSADIRSAVLDYRDGERKHKGPPDLADVLAAADILDGHFHGGKAEQVDWESVPQVFSALNLDQPRSEMLISDAHEQAASIAEALP